MGNCKSRRLWDVHSESNSWDTYGPTIGPGRSNVALPKVSWVSFAQPSPGLGKGSTGNKRPEADSRKLKIFLQLAMV